VDFGDFPLGDTCQLAEKMAECYKVDFLLSRVTAFRFRSIQSLND